MTDLLFSLSRWQLLDRTDCVYEIDRLIRCEFDELLYEIDSKRRNQNPLGKFVCRSIERRRIRIVYREIESVFGQVCSVMD